MVTKIEIVLKKPVRKQKIFLQHYLVMLVLEKNIPDLNNCIFIMIQSPHSQVWNVQLSLLKFLSK